MRSVWLALLVSGCVWVDGGTYEAEIQDVDGDGVIAERFGGSDCDDTNPEIGNCDADGDGFRSLAGGGEDCDDSRASVHPEAPEVCDGVDNDCDSQIDLFDEDAEGFLTYYTDADRDGFGDPLKPVPSCSADPVAGTVRAGDDCLDDDPDVGATRTWFVDEDGDGFGSDLEVLGACEPAVGEAALGGDCNDDDDSIFPGANDPAYDGIDADCAGDDDYDLDGDGVAGGLGNDCDDLNPDISPLADERCDGIDNDCDGMIDDADTELEDPTGIPWSLDSDGDGYGVPVFKLFCAATGQPDGYVADATDCNDDDAAVHPTAAETCDGRDEDCDGTADNGAEGTTQLYSDADGDGYGNPLIPISACAPYPGVVADNTDCNDANADENPGLDELDYCGDLIRNDCSTEFGPRDCDSDGLEDSNFGGTDCDDLDPLAGNSPEICDGSDNDCDGFIDQADPDVDLSTAQTYYEDDDGDGHGNPAIEYPGECTPPPGTVALSDDCDDDNSEASPTTEELCDGIDNDCDGTIDEPTALDARTWYADDDGDGFGTLANTRLACDQPAGYAPNADDCNDTDPYESPGELEVCDTVDNNCDGLVDDAEGTPLGAPAWYLDGDGDGIGLTSQIAYSCAQPAGYVVQGGDCDDSDTSVLESRNFYPDLDFDGYGDENAAAVGACTAPVNHVINNLDCDDTAPGVSPEADEICGDVLDNNCNGQTDEGGVGGTSYWQDVDQDGFGDFFAAPTVACTAPVNAVANNQDCDDSDSSVVEVFWGPDLDGDGYALESLPTVSSCVPPLQGTWSNDLSDCDDNDPERAPDLLEVCDGENKDEDCDGLSNEDDDSVDPTTFDQGVKYEDLDGDGFGSGVVVPPACETEGAPFSGDCDDADPAVTDGMVAYDDLDGDGVGNPLSIVGQVCTLGPNQSFDGSDCADDDAARSPAWVELCDDAGVDEDCDANTVGTPYRGEDLLVGTNVIDIGKAVAGVCDGDTILLPYDDSVVMFESLVVDAADVTLRGIPGEHGEVPTIGAVNEIPALTASKFVVIENMEFFGGFSLVEGFPVLDLAEGGWLTRVHVDANQRAQGVNVSSGQLILDHSSVVRGDASFGGGIYLGGGADLTGIDSCEVSDNESALDGGGVYATLGSEVDLEDCAILRNTAHGGAGGGVYLEGGRLEIDECTFADNFNPNSLLGLGGAIYVGYVEGFSFIDDSLFESNHSRFGGGVYVAGGDGGFFQVSDTVFDGNTAIGGPGAFYGFAQRFEFENVEFRSNHSSTASVGSAIELHGPQQTTMIDVRFYQNSLSPSLDVLAGITTGGFFAELQVVDNVGEFVLDGGIVTVVDSLFVQSGTDTGAALRLQNTSNVFLSSNAFADNPGAAVDVGSYSYPTLSHNTLVGNGLGSNLGLSATGTLILADSTTCGGASFCSEVWVSYGDFQTYHPNLDPTLWNLLPRHDFEPAWAGTHGIHANDWVAMTDYNTDSDADGLLDGWELLMFGSVAAYNGSSDPDGDGRSNIDEHAAGTHAFFADTDGDGADDLDDGAAPLDPSVFP